MLSQDFSSRAQAPDVERKADHGPARGCSRGVSAGDNLGPMTSPPPADSGVPWSLVQLGSRGLTPEASELADEASQAASGRRTPGPLILAPKPTLPHAWEHWPKCQARAGKKELSIVFHNLAESSGRYLKASGNPKRQKQAG